MHDPNDARVAALHKAIEDERREDLRRAQRFLQLANKVRAFRDGDGLAPTAAELAEWAEHTAKAAAVAERLAEVQAGTDAHEATPVLSDFGDSTILAASNVPQSQRSPQIEWTEIFAYAFLALATDAGEEAPDIPLLRARGAGLWLEHHNRDAIEVAQREFDNRRKG